MLPLDPKALPISDLLTEGLYTRAMFVPAGTYVRGAAKRKEYVTIVAKGEVVVNEEGVNTILVAPAMFKSKAGIERDIFANSASVLITVHAVTATDIDSVEAEVLCDSTITEN